MAVVEIKGGARIDVLSSEEYHHGSDAMVERLSARYTARKWMRYPKQSVPVVGGAVALRSEASGGPKSGYSWSFKRLSLTGLTASAPAGASSTTTGSVGSPGAAATITSQVLPAGTYTVQWNVTLSGTLAAGDTNNLQLTNGATQVATSSNGTTVGQTYTQQTATVVVPAGGATVAVKSIAAGTAGSTYAAQMTATPQATQADVVNLYRGDQQDVAWQFTGNTFYFKFGLGELMLDGGEWWRLANVGALAAAGPLTLTGELVEVPTSLAGTL